MSFKSTGLKAELLRAVEKQGYSEPTAVQAQTIPSVIEWRDVLAGAQTGTGKTAAFALPILHNLSGEKPVSGWRAPRSLVLTPTRELADQDFSVTVIEDACASYNPAHHTAILEIFQNFYGAVDSADAVIASLT